MAAVRARVESALGRLLPPADALPPRLHAAMRYAVLDGGKRVRPLLAFAAGGLAGAADGRVEIAACAVEMIHAYSLAHDEYDEATALLVGDALQSMAFQLISEHPLSDDAARQLGMVKLLAVATGSRGMVGGQALDLAGVGKALSLPELENMHIHKTGALIRAAVLLGARCGAPLAAEERLDHYAKCIGLAFQVIDDVLDCETPTATLGKTAGKDAAAGKPTYVSLLGMARAKALAEELRVEAHQALAGFGAGAMRLAQLADFIVLRKF